MQRDLLATARGRPVRGLKAALVISRDLTERRRVEEQRERLLEREMAARAGSGSVTFGEIDDPPGRGEVFVLVAKDRRQSPPLGQVWAPPETTQIA